MVHPVLLRRRQRLKRVLSHLVLMLLQRVERGLLLETHVSIGIRENVNVLLLPKLLDRAALLPAFVPEVYVLQPAVERLRDYV